MRKTNRDGTFFRRKYNKYLPLDSGEGTIYYRYSIHGKRKAVCCETTDEQEAREWVSKYLGFAAHCSNYPRFLDNLIQMGEAAKREKEGIIGNTNNCTKIENVPVVYRKSMKRPHASEKTLNYYQTIWEQFEKWLNGRVQYMEDVSEGMVENYLTELEGRRKKSTCEAHRTRLTTMFKYISSEVNPVADLKITKADDRTPHRRLTVDECQLLPASTTYADEQLLIKIAYYTGLRQTHACHLKIEQFDFEKRLYFFNKSDFTPRKGVPMVMPLHPALQQEIQSHLEETKLTKGHLMPRMIRLFGKDGARVSEKVSNIYRRAEVTDNESGTIGLHSLRVTFQSALNDASLSHTIVAYLMGHSLGEVHRAYSQMEISALIPQLEAAIPTL